ncbi:MAG: SEC-C metal-binding domain-containing protein [Myxococcota bacterium]
MEDSHFLSRLERVSARQVELALELYRNPELVRFLLTTERLENAERVAIAIGDPRPDAATDRTAGPFVIVTRDGRFVTCLGEGMRPGDLPIVTRARLDYLGERHVEVKAQLAYCEAVTEEGGALRRLLRSIFTKAHRLPRETIATLVPLVPLFNHELASILLEHQTTMWTLVGDLPVERLLRRADRWTSSETDLAIDLWRGLWTLSHLHVLTACEGEDATAVRTTRLPHPKGLMAAFVLGLDIPFWPTLLRTAWSALRMGGRSMVPSAKSFLGAWDIFYPLGIGNALCLYFAAVALPKLRAEIQKALTIAKPDEGGARTGAWRNYLARLLDAQLAPDEAHCSARASLYKVGNGLGATQDAQAVLADLDTPAGRGHVTLGGATLANLFIDPFSDSKWAPAMPFLAPWFAKASPEDLYWPGDALDEHEGPWTPKLSLDILRGMQRGVSVSRQKAEPRRVGPTVGRNDPCPCGSGKKHKRCCG